MLAAIVRRAITTGMDAYVQEALPDLLNREVPAHPFQFDDVVLGALMAAVEAYAPHNGVLAAACINVAIGRARDKLGVPDLPHRSFVWSIGSVVSAVLAAGLTVRSLQEFAEADMYPGLGGGNGCIPATYLVTAVR